MLNFMLGCIWLGAALFLLGYEFTTGETLVRIRGLNISSGWFFVVLSFWNFARWFSGRSWRAEQESLRVAHEARLRQVRYRERPSEPDPTFDFTDKPTPKSPPDGKDWPTS